MGGAAEEPRRSTSSEGATGQTSIRLLGDLLRHPEQFQRLLDFLPHRLFVKDEEGRFLLANRATAEVFGMSVDQVVGRRHEELPGDPGLIRKRRQDDLRVLRHDQPLVIAAEEHTDALGRKRVYRTVKVPFPIEHGQRRVVLGLAEDVTEAHRTGQWFEATFDNAPCGIVVTDARGNIVMVNRELEQMTGHDCEELRGRHVSVLVPKHLRAKHAEARRTLLADPEEELSIRGRDAYTLRRDGTSFPVEVGMNPVELPDGTYILSTVVDVTRRKRDEQHIRRLNAEMQERVRRRTNRLRATNQRLRQEVRERRLAEEQLRRAQATLSITNRELQQIAMRDPLTGLFNRRYLDQCLDHEWRRARRNGRCLSLLIADIDRFKAYNDALGHPEGDRCLERVAATLATCIRRPADVLSRYGGEEFAIVLPETGLRGARRVAERMRVAVETLALPHPRGGLVTVSLGVASSRRDSPDDPRNLVARADAALYRAKGAGRNRVALAER